MEKKKIQIIKAVPVRFFDVYKAHNVIIFFCLPEPALPVYTLPFTIKLNILPVPDCTAIYWPSSRVAV